MARAALCQSLHNMAQARRAKVWCVAIRRWNRLSPPKFVKNSMAVAPCRPDFKSAGLGQAFLPGGLGFGLLECFGRRAGIRQGADGARADGRDALTCQLVRTLIHGVAGMATHPVP